MCRVLSYLGSPISIAELLYNPDNSFIKQSYDPKYMSNLLNLAGFGLVAWDPTSHNPDLPFVYKTARLPFYDENLKKLANKIKSPCFITHIRGVSYEEKNVVSDQNVHPFIFDGTNIALAHNGSLTDFDNMKVDLLKYIKPKYMQQIHGTTDSEWIYALFLSQLPESLETCEVDHISEGIIKTLKILQQVRKKCGISVTSPVNLFISNGKFLAATRFALDYGWNISDEGITEHDAYHSLWYTYGERYGFYNNEYKMKNEKKKSCIIIASEPLTQDTTTWIELPEYTLIIVRLKNKEVEIISKDIVL